MSIWGHQRVQVLKDVQNKQWVVSTVAGAHLVTVPWADAFKEFPYHKDYAEAISTCQSDPDTKLTPQEAAMVLYAAKPDAQPSPTPQEAPNVVRVDFRRKRRLS